MAPKLPEKNYIGFTGSFGSGCTELAKILSAKFNLGISSLSDHLKRCADGKDLPRSKFQDIGDKLRKADGNHILAQIAVEDAKDNKNGLIFDSIKHPDEIKFLRKKYRNFFVFSIFAPATERWERVRHLYEKHRLNQENFFKDDNRDRGEETLYGQQVNKCNLSSDFLINNPAGQPARENFKKIEQYISLLLNNPEFFIPPTYEEILMNHAFNLSKRSTCLKRQVGAVVCSKDYYIISSGFNDTPTGIETCRVRGNCYRDLIRKCPKCRQKVSTEVKCSKCGDKLAVLNSSSKMLDLCRAVHAEENAILQIPTLGGSSLKDTKLFTTTFPCLLCAKKIITVGIKEVIYIDLYPVKASWDMLAEAGIEIDRYEGVMPRSFMRVFNS